jgi:hypothetical protein
MRDYQVDEEVTVNFGALPNAQLLLRHSMIETNNPHDCVALQMGVQSVVWSLVSERMFGRPPSAEYATCLPVNLKSDDKVLKELRVIVSNVKEMDDLEKVLEGRPISLRNEAQMLRAIYFALNAQSYPVRVPLTPGPARTALTCGMKDIPDTQASEAVRMWRLYAQEHRQSVKRASERVLQLWMELLLSEDAF